MAPVRGFGRADLSRGVCALLAALVATPAVADRIVLRGAGQIRGKVEPDKAHPDRVVVTPERGKTPLSFRKDQIAEVVAEPSALDEYVTRRDRAGATAQAQYDLGLWCERHKLADLAECHFGAAVASDPQFAPAHQKLGGVKIGDRWFRGDALREAQGLVRDRGQWITREEKDERDKDRAALAQQASWARQIRVLRDAMRYGSDDRNREAEAQLLAIRDPSAVRPLLSILGDESSALRMQLARVLGGIPGADATRALVRLLLAETEADVRVLVVDELDRREGPEARATLVKALRAQSPEVVNRAAWALAQLRAVSSVPSLIGVLVTSRVETVMVPASGTFGSVAPTPGYGGTPIAYTGSATAYLNGIAMAPGAVAYGASSVSNFPLMSVGIPGAPVSPGLGSTTGVGVGGGVSASRGPTPRLVTVAVQNVEVRRALVGLTGEDFGFDVAAWKRWVRSSFQPEPVPARRVPQP